MLIIGHRGAKGLAPENTLASIEKAIEHHVDMVEFDLRVTKDNVVVLHHDPELTDPNGQKHIITSTKFQTLKEHKPDLATFDDVLKHNDNGVGLFVEIKPGENTKPIVQIIENLPSKLQKNIWLASFDQSILLNLQAALPGIPKVVIEKWSGLRAGSRARQLNTKKVCMNQKWLWWGFIRSVKRSGWELHAYTLNGPKKANRWAKYGLAGAVTDYPDLFEK